LVNWDGGLPIELQRIWDLLFGPEQQSLVQIRTELEQLRESLNQAIEELDDLQSLVINRLADFEQIIFEDLPSIRDLSSQGNPFQGMQEATVTVGNSTRTVRVGFQIDQEKAAQQKAELGSLREGFAGYQDAFIEQAGLLDAKLQQLDEIFFQSGQTFSVLMQRYNGIYTDLVHYIEQFIRFQQENVVQFEQNLEDIQVTETIDDDGWPTMARTNGVIHELMSWTASNLSAAELANWIELRIALINLLIESQGGEADYMAGLEILVEGGVVQIVAEGAELPDEAQGLSPNQLFAATGVELWWNIPNEGWQLSISLSEERIEAAIASFRESAGVFQESWGIATGLSDTVYDRKADLYTLLYEIYDQLAVYGSGMIAVSGAGNVSGIAGLAGSGLACRTSVLSQAIAQESIDLPAGMEAPDAPTVGPLRPLMQAADSSPGQAVQPLALDQIQPVDGASQVVIPLGENSGGLPASGVFDRVLDPNTTIGYLDDWIPVTRYFEGRRSEIDPYLQIPFVDGMIGSVVSRDRYSAFFSGQFEGSHPIGVVEYACSVRGGVGGGYHLGPWLSTGVDQQIADTFLYGYDIEGSYVFDLRVRGAGGLTIQRQGLFDLEYFDPEAHSEPLVSNLDTSDNSPPVEPWFGLADTITSNPEELYAEWLSADGESGIQRYEYAVGTFSAPEGAAGAAEEEEEGSGGGGGFWLPEFNSALEAADQLDGLSGDDGLDPGELSADTVPTDIVPWTDAGGRTEVIIKNLDLQHNHEYVVSVRATNGVGLQSTGSSDPILVDLTPPEGIQIAEFIQETEDGYPNSVKFEFSFGEDPETGVAAHYFALGSSETTDDLFPWTEAVLDFGRIVNLPVTAGTPIYLLVKGVNILGLEAVVTADLELSFVDNSPPPAPMVVTVPQQSSNDGSELAIGWNEVQDPGSGIVSYAYGISSLVLEGAAAETDIVPWVTVVRTDEPYYIGKRAPDLPVLGAEEEGEGAALSFAGFGYLGPQVQVMGVILGTDYEIHREDLALSGRVYASVKVTNGAGLTTVSSSPLLIFDATPPETAMLQAEAQQSNLGVLELTLNAGDRESGIESYRYEIYRTAAQPNLAWAFSSWQDAQAPEAGDMSRTILISQFPLPGLQYNNLYEIRFWVRNRTGLVRAANPVTIEIVPFQGEGDTQVMPDRSKRVKDVIDLRRGQDKPFRRESP
jgi:hypothetical protein